VQDQDDGASHDQAVAGPGKRPRRQRAAGPGKDERENFAALIDSISKVTEMASESAPAANGRRRTATATGAINPELTALSRDIDPDGLAVASKKDDFRRELAEHLGKMFPKP